MLATPLPKDDAFLSLSNELFQEGKNVPSNLLDDVANESSALAQVTLGPADAGFDDAGGCFLYFRERDPDNQPTSIICSYASMKRSKCKDPPRGETVGVHLTWPRLIPCEERQVSNRSFKYLSRSATSCVDNGGRTAPYPVSSFLARYQRWHDLRL
jgi:hypothetical protein